MIEVIFLFLIGLLWIIFASVEDVRTREVANWISFSLVIFVVGFRFFYSFFNNNFNFLLQGVLGLGIFIVLGNLLYYSRMFAGGDAKLMMALGPVLGYSLIFMDNLKLYGLFFFLFLVSGAIYGLTMTFVVSIRNCKKFKRGYKETFSKSKRFVFIIMFVGVVVFLFGFFFSAFFSFGVIIFLFPFFYVYAKSVDNFCMVRNVLVKDLTEGDWLFESVKIGGKKIEPSWEGLNKKEIDAIRKKRKKVKIKQGIAYVPVFLISYVVYFCLYINGFPGWLF